MRIAGARSLPAASCDAKCVSLTRKPSGKTLLQGWFSLEQKTFRPLWPEYESQMISILNFPRELLVPPLG